MKDIVVVQSLRKRGIGLNDMQEVLRYEAIERLPRVLDKSPKRLTLTKASDIVVYGCCAEFIMCYNDKKENINIEQATLDLRGVKRFCDPEIYVALLTLIEQGVCCSKDRSMACFDIFKLIMTTPGGVLTKDRVKDTLNKYCTTGYYDAELVKALNVCLFNANPVALYWVNLCEYSGFYNNAIELGKTVISEKCKEEKDVEKFLRPIYKEAKEDKEFINSLYKQGANKWLIPMIYYLKDSHPEALDPDTKEGGFS